MKGAYGNFRRDIQHFLMTSARARGSSGSESMIESLIFDVVNLHNLNCRKLNKPVVVCLSIYSMCLFSLISFRLY